MGNVSKARRNVSIRFGIWAIVLCMAAGLILNMRPLTILKRSAISFAIAFLLGYVLASGIEILSSVKKVPSKERDKSEEKEEPAELKEQDIEEGNTESQNDQGVAESGV